MPPKSKINKQDILTSSLEIIRKSGFEEVNARSIAKEMNCSTNPIFRVYKNMDELKEELIEEIYKYYREFTDIYVDENDELYRVSYAYIEFARKEKNLFKAVYISDIGGQRTLSQIIQSSYNQNIIKKIEKDLKRHQQTLTKQYQISFDEACQLFQNIRFYTHGIATYVLVDSISLSQEEVSELLKIAIKNFRNAKN